MNQAIIDSKKAVVSEIAQKIPGFCSEIVCSDIRYFLQKKNAGDGT